MTRHKFVFSFLAVIVPFVTSGQAGNDFSGTWKMDLSRSESAHQGEPIDPVTLVIRQTPKELIVETRRGTTKEVLTYNLDRTENTANGADDSPVTCTARWDGAKLVTGTARNIKGQAVTTQNVYSLGRGAKEMTVSTTLTVQHGYQFSGAKNYGTGTDVYIRVKPAVAERQ